MAKENVAKFYEKLAEDPALAERLQAADAAYVRSHRLPTGMSDEEAGLAFYREAATTILLPMAAEEGLPFTLEELEACEQERTDEVSDDEMAQVAGGKGVAACRYVGVGVGYVRDKTDAAGCVLLGFGGFSSGIAKRDVTEPRKRI